MRARRVVLAAGVALSVVSAAGAVALAHGRADRADAADAASTPAPPAEQLRFRGQRLVPDRSFIVTRSSDSPEPRLVIPSFEILPSGSIVPALATTGRDESAEQVVTAADGRVAIGATRDLAPGVKRPDGPFVTDLEFPLLVFSARGDRVVDEDLRIRGEYVSVLGLLGGQVFLARSAPTVSGDRPVRVVSRSLESGRERVLTESRLAVSRGDAAGRHLAFGGAPRVDAPAGTAPPRCWAQVVDVGTSRSRRLEVPDCARLVGLKLSPDGMTLALAYEHLAQAGPELMLTVVDLAAGTSDRYQVNRYEDCASCLRAVNTGYLGMAWTSRTTLRMALLHPVPLRPGAAEVTLGDVSRRVVLRDY